MISGFFGLSISQESTILTGGVMGKVGFLP